MNQRKEFGEMAIETKARAVRVVYGANALDDLELVGASVGDAKRKYGRSFNVPAGTIGGNWPDRLERGIELNASGDVAAVFGVAGVFGQVSPRDMVALGVPRSSIGGNGLTALVNGVKVDETHPLMEGDSLEFVKLAGRKG